MASLFAASLLASSANAATIPYTNDFSGTGSNTDLFESPANSYTLSGGVR
jgi:hypothetical protein